MSVGPEGHDSAALPPHVLVQPVRRAAAAPIQPVPHLPPACVPRQGSLPGDAVLAGLPIISTTRCYSCSASVPLAATDQDWRRPAAGGVGRAAGAARVHRCAHAGAPAGPIRRDPAVPDGDLHASRAAHYHLHAGANLDGARGLRPVANDVERGRNLADTVRHDRGVAIVLHGFC